ncbi:hypothetical protein DM867_12870 [Halosegnis rubeus]|jgi:RNA polymerase-binding transcription factor DksA|uniref:DUF7552 domain-containing protein n=1 Tax=Halosegnis rubeus TaxID=2212850 RepID=A0A5N5U2Q5_9EURY|nr:hypothetical protein [Halosegnis rubeus]KAB7512477.1 hypothetical protein DM867_12870 [Halosegnis rubeus]KAB7512737.1 hypothetical protein DMP03_13885 [Halosegnis rubeus]KAB7514094.1 hypothetical protein DP108_12355 [Halosegnis rubeus]
MERSDRAAGDDRSEGRMSESPLHALRDRIETLASESGSYYLVCARCGDRPVPAARLRFDSRAVARASPQT